MSKPIFYDRDDKFWHSINNLGNIKNHCLGDYLEDLLYTFGCKCQQLEGRVEELEKQLAKKDANAINNQNKT